MRRLFIAFIAVVYSLLSQASQESERKEALQWLSELPEHGIDVQPKHWQLIGNTPTKDQIREVVNLYTWYMDAGILNRHYYQPGWTIKDVATTPTYSGLTPPLDRISPDIPEYKHLIKALKQLRNWKRNAYSLFPNDFILFDGDSHSSIKLLNQWLENLDLADDLPDDVYTQVHKDVLTEVQLRFKLVPDGRLGNMTRQALLSITNERIRTVKANMERLRWLPRTLPYPRVWVDIAGYTTRYQRNPKDSTTHKIIIGVPHKQSPILQSEIEKITINPTWKVPHSIAKSLLKKEKQNPGFFLREKFKVYKSWDDNSPEIAPDSVNWKAVTPKSFTYRLEQQPGELNRLGQFKLGFKNSFGVYLHDTDKPELFEKERRAFSSGCIRVHHVKALVETIAKEQGLASELKAALNGNYSDTLELKKKIPVYTVYFTAWPDKNGRVRFRDDIYQLDNALISEF
ncbi:L,D-transpeptidase family protein [uncultured Endozoicomonas sp.]|uniref:L,D-transpeptidase family protein n=1 Tax=uncultured Endozoicomonas sp. TaxID=432652 RepID=UPI00262572F6|nr:L,D-transpeptidase family protein [uncultured Endozoicomonas sp.]